MTTHHRRRLISGAALATLFAASASHAQTASDVTKVEEVVVVGTQIKGAKTTEALPVKVVSSDEIAATGAVSGDDLMRQIPQIGDVFFNPTNQAQTSNTARGDISSVDLRNAGIGDTLVLLNGRRLVAHPTSNGNNTVPLISFNSSSIPAAGLERLEVLFDGAGAIYGSDAVAGVINTVMKTNFTGLTVSSQMGGAEGTHRRETSTNVFAGKDFAGGKGNISLAVSLVDRTKQYPGDMPFTANQDLRPLFANTKWAGSATADGRGNQSSWINAQLVGISTAIRQGTTALTTAAGAFHIQPNTIAGCATQLGNGLCLGTGGNSQGNTSPGNILKYNAPANNYTTISPSIHRQNVYAAAHYDLSDELTAYGEFGLYHATAHSLTTQPTSLVPVGVPSSNYWNPFGPVTFADGTVNPNRLPGLTNVPASGLALTFNNYRFNDYGPDRIDTENYQWRYLAGLKGEKWGWNWDSGLLYSYATAKDVSDGVDSNALYKQLALSTPDAYNPFNGSCLDGAGGGDCTPSSQKALDATRIRLTRKSKTGLLLADFKVSSKHVLTLWGGGELGMAAGVEARHETQQDDRDPHVNGALPFFDAVTGLTQPSSATGVNVTPSSKGSRDVFSAFAEFAVPVVTPEMNIPLVRALNFQVAGRYEHYSDFGDVAKPKVAMSWDVIKSIRVRASYQEGFKAPNLETTANYTYGRAVGVTDYYKCEADVRAGRLTNFNACSRGLTARYFISGNPNLGPETSTSTNVGVVFMPTFIPAALGQFTITLDRWRLNQEGIVGVLGSGNVVAGDYLNRVTGGSGSAAIVRSAPNADDIAAFASTGLTAVGNITDVKDTFQNLQPQKLSGWDLSGNWRKRTERFGRFDANFTVSLMDRYQRSPLVGVDDLFAARTAGTINAATPLSDPGNQIRVYGKPRWKQSANMTWRGGAWQVGLSENFIGFVEETGFLAPDGAPWRVKSQVLWNGYVQYEFKSGGWTENTKVRLGARNLFDRLPPLATGGFNGGLYNPYGRYLYGSISKSF